MIKNKEKHGYIIKTKNGHVVSWFGGDKIIFKYLFLAKLASRFFKNSEILHYFYKKKEGFL